MVLKKQADSNPKTQAVPRDFNRPETQSRAVSSDGSVNVVLEPLDRSGLELLFPVIKWLISRQEQRENQWKTAGHSLSNSLSRKDEEPSDSNYKTAEEQLITRQKFINTTPGLNLLPD